MTIGDLRCPDGKFATELGRRVFAWGGHDNENGNVAVCGASVRIWIVVGFRWSWLDARGPAEGPEPRASDLWGRQDRGLAKRRHAD